jgi:diphthamide biosynthesis protein 3
LIPQCSVSLIMSTTYTSNIYDEIEIEDFEYDAVTTLYTYPCPCGDLFQISLGDLRDAGEAREEAERGEGNWEEEDLEQLGIAECPSCSLQVRVIFELVSLSHGY